jgi:predicted PurR-regulated permease PerM
MVVITFVLLRTARGLGVPLFLATAGAYVLGPVATALERRGMSRTAAVALIYLGGVLLLVGSILFGVPTLNAEAAKVPVFLTKALEKVIPLADRYLGLHLTNNIAKLRAELTGKLSSMGDELWPYALKALGSTASILVALLGLLVVPVIAFHFIRLSPSVIERLSNLVPARYRTHVINRFHEVDRVLGAFIRGQLTVGAILASIYGIGFSAAGLDMAVGIALVAGFGNMVPYAGTGMGLVLATLSMLVSQLMPWQVAVVVATFLLAQTMEALIITPRIVGGQVGLHPVAIILAVLGFGELFGFVGVLLAVPTTAALTVVARVLIDRYRASAIYTGH